ncbi:hypothetical protein ACFPIJ_16900 [Dactylosporangium cerinum]|uniref:Uncharacterized protein n=1 Tax=Dactylosporangium cerinum TaxID=1434730 RepID=A0ABV9VUL2_9ACTN
MTPPPGSGRTASALDGFTFDHVVDGVVEAKGEWPDDRWRIEVRANAVYVVRLLTEPDYAEYPRTHRDDWTDEQRADFAARTRHISCTWCGTGGMRWARRTGRRSTRSRPARRVGRQMVEGLQPT